MIRRAFVRTACAAALLAAACASALAQDAYPSKPIKLVVPFPAAGGTDVLSRAIAQSIATNTQWLIVIDNKPGAGGNIGLEAASKAPPDGYTIAMGQTANLAVIGRYILTPRVFDPLKDLHPSRSSPRSR
jgi:tripartite-type tricarboxylate transporter receptor subunit TctC